MNMHDLKRRLRKVPNLTHFSARSGVSRSTLHRLLAGWPNPSLRVIEAVEKQLGREGVKWP